jgi:hypothetical protein
MELIPKILFGFMGICVLALIYFWIQIAISTHRINKLDEQIAEARYRYAISEAHE